jgi:hypothetical protein
MFDDYNRRNKIVVGQITERKKRGKKRERSPKGDSIEDFSEEPRSQALGQNGAVYSPPFQFYAGAGNRIAAQIRSGLSQHSSLQSSYTVGKYWRAQHHKHLDGQLLAI